MKYLKKFNESVNPTDKQEIKRICEKYNINNYTINPDGTVDVDGDVNFYKKNLDKLPLKFGKVSGNFNCDLNKLTTLKGVPKEVGGYFSCSCNQLTALDDAPKVVGGEFFDCSYNKLNSLRGAPKEVVGGYLNCFQNQLTSLEGAPKKFSFLQCGSNKIFMIDKDTFDIESLKKTKLLFGKNPINRIVNIFGAKFLESLKYNYFLGGNKIHESRFVRACDDLGKKCPEKINQYIWV